MKDLIELAIAADAGFYCQASLELNTYSEAEVLEIGSARAVYSGTFSPVHGVYGIGIDGPMEEKEFLEICRFFERKERAPGFWITPFTHPSVLEFLHSYKVMQTQKICAISCDEINKEEALGDNKPNLDLWAKHFKTDNALAALTRLHQKNIRFYLEKEEASCTFFHNSVALVHKISAALKKQLQDAKEFQCKYVAHFGEGPLPVIYERNYYEKV